MTTLNQFYADDGEGYPKPTPDHPMFQFRVDLIAILDDDRDQAFELATAYAAKREEVGDDHIAGNYAKAIAQYRQEAESTRRAGQNRGVFTVALGLAMREKQGSELENLRAGFIEVINQTDDDEYFILFLIAYYIKHDQIVEAMQNL